MKDGKPIVTGLAKPTTKVLAKRDADENEASSALRALERPRTRRPSTAEGSGEAQSGK